MGLDQDVEGFEPGGGGLASGRLRRDQSSCGVFHGEMSLTPLPALVSGKLLFPDICERLIYLFTERHTPADAEARNPLRSVFVDRTAVPSEQDRDAEIELSGVAVEIRQRRKLLGLSQVQLAEVSHVSRTVINKVEQGARVPSIRTYARLRASLGLEAPPAALIPAPVPTRLDGDLVAALSAGLLMTREVSLGELASALDLAIPAVRENLDRVGERLHGVGFSLTEDGGTVRLWPLTGAPSEVVKALTVTEEDAQPSPEQVQILGLVAYFGQMTRALIEHFRQEDSASLLDRMVKRGLLAKVRSDFGVGSPNIYRVTAKALRAAGYPTVEAMRAVIQASLSAAEQMSLQNGYQEEIPGREETAFGASELADSGGAVAS